MVERVAIGCVEGRTLVESLNFTESVQSFLNLTFPAAPNWTGLLTPPELASAQAVIANLNITTFSNQTFAAAVSSFNSLLCGASPCCPTCVNESNVEEFDVSSYPSNVQTAHREVVYLKYDIPILQGRLETVRTNLSVALNTSGLEAEVLAAQTQLDSMEYVLTPFKDAVDNALVQVRL